MALKEFWNGMQRACEDLLPSTITDANTGRVTKKYHDLWATLSCIQGYDDADFDFLPNTQRTELKNAVMNLRSVIEKVPANGPVTREQVEIAKKILGTISRILGFDKYPTPGAFVDVSRSSGD